MEVCTEPVVSNWFPYHLLHEMGFSKHLRDLSGAKDEAETHDFNVAFRNECMENCVRKCSNRQLTDGFVPLKTSVKDYSGVKGKGLRSEEEAKKGQFIMEYIGKVKTRNEYENEYRENPVGKKYYMIFTGNLILDASYYGNNAKYANSSCDPNMDAEVYFDAHGLPHVVLVANQDIPKFAELTYNYNIERLPGTERMECHCGKPNCLDNPGLQKPRSNKILEAKAGKDVLQKSKSFKCKQCQHIFTTKSNYIRHLKERHTDGTHFDCQTCGKSFKRKGHLNIHLRTHMSKTERNNAKKIECTFCDMRFIENFQLNEHIRVVHNSDKTFRCDKQCMGKKCNYEFKTLSRRNFHLNHECVNRRLGRSRREMI